jgi:hypothetical protein
MIIRRFPGAAVKMTGWGAHITKIVYNETKRPEGNRRALVSALAVPVQTPAPGVSFLTAGALSPHNTLQKLPQRFLLEKNRPEAAWLLIENQYTLRRQHIRHL